MSKPQTNISNLSTDNSKNELFANPTGEYEKCFIPKSLQVDMYMTANEGFRYNPKIAVIAKLDKLESSERSKEIGDLMKRPPVDGNDEYLKVANSHHVNAT